MKFKTLLSLVLISAAFLSTASAQTQEGDWYTPIRHQLLLVTISADSVIFKKGDFDAPLRDYEYTLTPFKIEKKANGTFIVSAIKDSVLVYCWLSFRLSNGRNYLNIESLSKRFSTLADAENALSQLDGQPMEIVLLTKPAIDKVRQQKDIARMKPKDFINYAQKIMELDSGNAARPKKKYKLSYLYAESTGRVILADMGFNSLVKGNVFDAMVAKFAEEPATKEVFIKMTGGGK